MDELPGSHTSVLRTAQLRCDKPTVMVPERAIRRSWMFQCEGRWEKDSELKYKTKAMKAEVRLIN